MRLINILFIMWPLLGCGDQLKSGDSEQKPLFVCYGKIDPNSVVGYELVVLEARHFTPQEIKIFRENNKNVLAYISLTEVNENDPLFKKLKPYCLQKNNTWNSRFIDIAHNEVAQIVIERIKEIKQQGFNGLFMDNLDNVSQWGKLKHHEEELVSLMQKIRTTYPRLYLCQNSGLSLSKKIAETTDAVLIESVVTNYNFKKDAYAFREKKSKKERLKEILDYSKTTNKPIYVLEYAGDVQMSAVISKELKPYKLPFYITQIDLQSPSKFHKLNK